MGTYQYAQKEKASQLSQTSVPRTSAIEASVQPPLIQEKSNEEGLAEHAERLRKLQRLGNSFMQMGSPRHVNDKTSPIQPKPWIQRNSTLGQPKDGHEQKADRVADQLVDRTNSLRIPRVNQNQTVQQQKAEKDTNQTMRPFAEAIQRMKQGIEDPSRRDLEPLHPTILNREKLLKKYTSASIEPAYGSAPGTQSNNNLDQVYPAKQQEFLRPELIDVQKHSSIVQQFSEPEEKPLNRTGMPNHLKDGIENLSGMAMDDVRVHYNSAKPAQLEALAYAQGTDIYIGPGQEKLLPHEGWHVVQQMQARVQPTRYEGGVAVNGDEKLEREATEMGERASRRGIEVNWRSRMSEGREPSGSWLAKTSKAPVSQKNGKPEFSSTTHAQAPDKTSEERKLLGISEKVDFRSKEDGTWKASAGSPLEGEGKKFEWTAPQAKKKVTISLTNANNKKKEVQMSVIEPTGVKTYKYGNKYEPADANILPTDVGASMAIKYVLQPTYVNFDNMKMREKSGPATEIEGYYQNMSKDELWHNANDKWSLIFDNEWPGLGYDKVKANEYNHPEKSDEGKYTWAIPLEFQVKGKVLESIEVEGVKQKHILSKGRKMRIEKGDAWVERTAQEEVDDDLSDSDISEYDWNNRKLKDNEKTIDDDDLSDSDS